MHCQLAVNSLAENVGVALQYHAQQRADEFTAVCGIMLVIACRDFTTACHAIPVHLFHELARLAGRK